MLGSFQIRLIIAFIALFAAVSVAVSFAGLTLREQQARRMFDDDLRLRAELVLDTIRKEPKIDNDAVAKAVRRLSDTRYFSDSFVQVYNDDSEPIARSANLGDVVLKLRRPFEDTSMDGVIVEGTTVYQMPRGPTTVRGLRVRFSGTDGEQYIALVAADPKGMYRQLRETRWIFFAGNVGGLAAAGAAAWFVTRAMSKRIGLLVDQIELVGPENLDRRIELQDRDEITEVAAHINAALDRLKAGFDTQERFIHDASHELRTPIASVQAEAQALLLSDPTKEELMDFASSVNDEMRRLGRLTGALLLLTRNDEKVILSKFKPVDIAETITEAIQHLSTMACDYQVRVSVHYPDGLDDSPVVRGDPELIEAMISNLIRNAIRFSPRGSEVRVTLSTAERLELTVDDDGPGIPADILPSILERFSESSTQRVRRGGGLGLAIARTVAVLHGGSIRASNRPEGGARFSVLLPMVQATVPTPAS
jgi:signal transduction histidine kinase